MATVKHEEDHQVGNTTASREPALKPSRRLRRDSSVATMVDGSIPYRDQRVRALSQAASVAPLTPAEMSSFNSPAGGELEMSEDTALPPGAMEKLGERSRGLIQVIQKLSAFNIDTTLPSLPKIILIGDQSAGKSSVIEALCDITLPRNEGTCTRCPFSLTTTSCITSSSAWTCKISILKKFAFLRSVQAGQNGEKYDNWQEQTESSSTEFSVVHRKEELDQALRRAQLAILNPGRDCQDFATIAVDSRQKAKTQVDFSPNVVCLEIASPKLPELSFYDLPGAINSMSDENDQYLVTFVETLLKTYIQDEKATVLLACAANQDIEVSTAIRFLTECKTSNGGKARDRAVGVLTKPDLVDDNPEKIMGIQNIMAGGGFRMGHGWFVTKQLSQKQLSQGVTHEEARRAESDFFGGGPWASDLVAHRNRFGTLNLQDALSKILTTHILSELPGIVARVKGRLSEVEQALATFPAQDAAPTIAIIQEIDALKTAIMSQLNADAISDFRTTYRDVFKDLQNGLVECRPIVALSTPGYVKPSISLDSSDDQSPSKKIKVRTNARASSATPRHTPAPTPGSSGNQNLDRRRKFPAGGSNLSVAVTSATRVEFNLQEVQRDFNSAPGADIPGGSSNIVIKKLILQTLCGWQAVVDKALKAVKTSFLRLLYDSVHISLAARNATELFKQASRIVRALFNELMAEQSAIIGRIIARETYRPITLAQWPMGYKKREHMAELQARRLKHRVREHFEDLESRGYKVVEAEIEKKSKDFAWASDKLGSDDYDREVKELATPLAYYDIASFQLVDTIARELEYGLLNAYEERVHRKLLEELRTGDVVYCAELLAEDPQRERERVALLVEKDKLTQALEELNRLPATHA